MIGLFTVQHTGTWTVAAYLYQHPEIDGFWELLSNKPIVHLNGLSLNRGMSRDALVLTHINYITAAWVRVLSQLCPCVITYRDPMASLITRHARHPEKYPHIPHNNTWKDWRDIHRLSDVFVLDVENPDWSGLSHYCGMNPIDPPENMNKGPRSPLHEAYANRDIDYIYAKIPISVDHLRTLGFETWWS